jgi:hypothetical protein
MGEGDIDIGNRVCAICSIVEFENELSQVSQEGYFKYLEERGVSDQEISYLDYFYKDSNLDSLKQRKTIFPITELPNFTKVEKYMVSYAYYTPLGEEESYRIRVVPYNSTNIEKLECKSYATSA